MAHWAQIVAVFPAASVIYSNAAESESIIRKNHNDLRGVYLWTHRESGHQYVGSAKNLNKRLSDYFRPSYLKTQTERGSIISRAILKHGLSAFSLSVQELGSSPDSSTVFNSIKIPDYVALEQTYLDHYTLAYNTNRFASSAAYNPYKGHINVGVDNPSFGKLGSESFVWNRTHSQEQKEIWSQNRSSYHYYIYNRYTYDYIKKVYSNASLSVFLNTSTSQVTRLRHQGLLDSTAVLCLDYIITLKEYSTTQLKVMVRNLDTVVVRPHRTNTILNNKNKKPIYGYNPSLNEYITWYSRADCSKFFQCQPRTILLRLDANTLFKGYLLKSTSFKQ